MAKNFPSDFYVTCATVIPVLFLAVAVQGRAYEAMLRVVAENSRRSPGSWGGLLRDTATSMFFIWFAWLIVLAGAFGEFYALLALYRESEFHLFRLESRATVFAATLILVVAVAAGPLLAYLNSARGRVALPPQASGQDEAVEGEHGRAEQPVEDGASEGKGNQG
jgi:hypothetical protein